MADSFVSKLITELTAKTTAVDTDLVPVADSNGNFFKMTWQKMKQLLLGTKDISSVGDGTVTGAISELNTNISIEETPLAIAAPNIDVNHAYATKIKKKIYACHGYIRCASTITADTKIFITGNLLNYSSLLLIGSTQQGYGNLIFENGFMTLVNTNLPAGYYYVCGIIVEE